MSRLKLIVERKQDVGSEFDLRDLGRDPLLTETHPFSTLSIHDLAVDEASSFEATATHHGLHAKVHADHKALIIHTHKLIAGEHKIQAIHLFAFLMKNLGKIPSHAHCLMTEVNRFKIHMKDAMDEGHHSLHATALTHIQEHHLNRRNPIGTNKKILTSRSIYYWHQ